jgi:hypothetical protein
MDPKKSGNLTPADNPTCVAVSAAEHDRWFREEVDLSIAEADLPDAVWISHEEASASWARKREEFLKRVRA